MEFSKFELSFFYAGIAYSFIAFLVAMLIGTRYEVENERPISPNISARIRHIQIIDSIIHALIMLGIWCMNQQMFFIINSPVLIVNLTWITIGAFVGQKEFWMVKYVIQIISILFNIIHGHRISYDMRLYGEFTRKINGF